jgi:hypothetical protein
MNFWAIYGYVNLLLLILTIMSFLFNADFLLSGWPMFIFFILGPCYVVYKNLIKREKLSAIEFFLTFIPVGLGIILYSLILIGFFVQFFNLY